MQAIKHLLLPLLPTLIRSFGVTRIDQIANRMGISLPLVRVAVNTSNYI